MVARIIPSALRKGDTIAIISPSGRYNEIFSAAHHRGLAYIEGMGFKVKVIFNNVTPDFTNPKTFREFNLLRCDEVHQAFRDPAVKAVICTSGGARANELLPHLDYELIKANPKIFVGYSDITMLHYAITENTGLQTFYGPCSIFQFGDSPGPLPFTVNHFLHVLQDSAGKAPGPIPRSIEWAPELPYWLLKDMNSLATRRLVPNKGWQWLRPGKATGRILGGALRCVNHASGTKYFPRSHEGKILLIETAPGETMSDPTKVQDSRSVVANLVNAGIFEQISGLVIGRHYAHTEQMQNEFSDMILGLCYGTDFPILMNVDIGHTDPILTIPMGGMVSLDSERDEFALVETCVKDD